MPPKSMTANPVRPARHRPGKGVAEEHTSSEAEAEEEEEDAGSEGDPREQQQKQQPTRQPPPKVTSFPSEAQRIASNLKNVDLNERRRQADAQERARHARERAERAKEEEEAGFVTESSEEEGSDREDAREAAKLQQPRRAPGVPAKEEDDDEEDGEEDEDDSEEGDSDSSSDAGPPKLLRPVFIRKDQRKTAAAVEEDTKREAEEVRRQVVATEIVQERLERDAAARAAGKKHWDDDDPAEEDAVDDTDGLDPELERQQWIARELTRLKRSRQALEEREVELAEIERRKGLTAEEREAEDREIVDRQQEEKKGRGKMAVLQKYHHKGAFYQADAKEQGLLDRDLMGATYVHQSSVREALPEYLQIRDETKIGRKGRTRYKDLKSEDTGRWGDFRRDDRRGGRGATGGDRAAPFVEDERFKPDMPSGPRGGTGANAGAVGEKRRTYDDDRRGNEKRPRYEERGC